MYMLVSEPHGEEASRAFSALDDAFGTDEFSREDALRCLEEHGFGQQMFNALVMSGSVSEV